MDYAIDVSGYDARRPTAIPYYYIYDQPTDWAKTGLQAAIIKSSQGLTKDKGFDIQWKAAAGILPRMAYHYISWDNPIQQADMFVATVGELGPNDRLVIDYEKDPKTNTCPSTSHLLKIVERVRRQTGQICYIYTGAYKWYEMGGAAGYNTWAAEYPLWLAQYPYDIATQPAVFDAYQMDSLKIKIESGSLVPLQNNPKFPGGIVKPWTEVAIWQFTARCSPAYVPGHPGIKKTVDYNVIYKPWYGEPVEPKRCPTCGQVIP